MSETSESSEIIDDSTALNAAIGQGNVIIQLEPRIYNIGEPLDGTKHNVTLRGIPGATKFIKLDSPSYYGICSTDSGRTYRGWTFDGIDFNGNLQGIKKIPSYHTATFFLDGASRIRFDRCSLRDAVSSLTLRNSHNISFYDCEFFGTVEGVFEKGVIDPVAVPDAGFSSGLSITESCRDINIEKCKFHFCNTGIAVLSTTSTSTSHIRIEDCDFRADWWDNPSPVLRFTPTSVNNGHVILASGGFQSFAPGQVISFRRDIASGTVFSSLYAGRIQADNNPFANAVIGDSIETADGRRARLTAIESPSLAWVEGWESIDTYEPIDPPSTLDISWRLSRYYACGIAAIISDTELTLYSDPVNMFTGERAIGDAQLDLSTLPTKVLARTFYSGIHMNGGTDGLLVSGNRFFGSWADQCSVFNTRSGVRIVNNSFAYGQDEGITLTNCPRAVVANNVFVNNGVSALFLGGSDFVTFTGNSIQNWGLTNPHGPAVDGFGGRCVAVTGNTFIVSPSTGPTGSTGRDWSRWAMAFHNADCTGSVFASNTDGGATVATLTVDLLGAPTVNSISARDVKTIVGEGAGNVNLFAIKDVAITGLIELDNGQKWSISGEGTR